MSLLDRFSLLEFITGGHQDESQPEAKPRKPRATVSYAPQLFDRGDLDIAMLSASLSLTTFTGLLMRSRNVVESMQVGVFVLCLTPTVIYGLRVLSRAAPDTASSAMQFRNILMPGPRLSTAKPQIALKVVPLTEEEANRQNLKRFLLAGKLAGSFSVRSLTLEKQDEHGNVIREKYMTDPAWRTYNRLFREKWQIIKTINGLTWFAPGWDYGRAVYHVRHNALTDLPDKPLPGIMI